MKINTNVNRFVRFIPQLYLHGKKMHVLHVADFPASKNLDLMEECMAV